MARTTVPSSADRQRTAEEDDTVARDPREPIAIIRKQLEVAEPDLLLDL